MFSLYFSAPIEMLLWKWCVLKNKSWWENESMWVCAYVWLCVTPEPFAGACCLGTMVQPGAFTWQRGLLLGAHHHSQRRSLTKALPRFRDHRASLDTSDITYDFNNEAFFIKGEFGWMRQTAWMWRRHQGHSYEAATCISVLNFILSFAFVRWKKW